MNKKLCLSIVISLICMPKSFASDAIVDAINEAKVSGEIKSLYFSQDFSDSSGKQTSSIWTNGGEFKLVSGDFHGFSLSSSLQVVDVTWRDDVDDAYKTSMSADGAVLSEAYLSYDFSNANTRVHLGRRYLAMPLLGGSSAQSVTESYEAYLITDRSLPQTVIVAGKIDRYQARTDFKSTTPFTQAKADAKGKPGEFLDIGEYGMYSLYMSNTSIANTNVQVHLVETQGIAFMGYADMFYQFDTRFKPYIGGQYYKTVYHDNTLGQDSDMLGLKLGVELIDNLDLFTGYNKTNDNGKVLHGLGNNAYANFTTTTKTSGDTGFEAGSNSLQLGVAYQIDSVKVKYRWTNFNPLDEEGGMTEHTLNLSYQFESLKQVSAMMDYSVMTFDNDARSMTDLRTKLIYRF
ncbi:hypothetical protein FM037_08110 [Shewanella psychropiezotolerans]|uniref:Porin n=1 Tax=Shewanella psychropiezotolerans TaxID=2593655 RepID=A0ABX5X1N9_9GAMM|nr:hypothetical protein [Shewanella psychropiezotolerans]QDO83196.1 hypothetical protein FM037_08110 [Shewanella psychropiezotolerans]